MFGRVGLANASAFPIGSLGISPTSAASFLDLRMASTKVVCQAKRRPLPRRVAESDGEIMRQTFAWFCGLRQAYNDRFIPSRQKHRTQMIVFDL
jgi:hypothetical protein